jgi:hypothetical protein
MRKAVFLFAVCGLITAGCHRQSFPDKASNRAYTTTFTAGNIAEVRDRSIRVYELEQELLHQGFKVLSTSISDSMNEVKLRGDYGGLKNADVTIWIGKKLEMKGPHFSAELQANVPDPAAEKEFENLNNHIRKAFDGK